MIGTGTQIGDGTSVRDSVLGRNCVIGANVKIQNSYLWGENVVEDGTVLDHAILANGVVVRKNATVERGSVLSFSTCIGEGFHVPAYSKISTFVDKDDEDDDGEGGSGGGRQPAWDPLHVGRGGAGRRLQPSGACSADSDDEDADADATQVWAWGREMLCRS